MTVNIKFDRMLLITVICPDEYIIGIMRKEEILQNFRRVSNAFMYSFTDSYSMKQFKRAVFSFLPNNGEGCEFIIRYDNKNLYDDMWEEKVEKKKDIQLELDFGG